MSSVKIQFSFIFSPFKPWHFLQIYSSIFVEILTVATDCLTFNSTKFFLWSPSLTDVKGWNKRIESCCVCGVWVIIFSIVLWLGTRGERLYYLFHKSRADPRQHRAAHTMLASDWSMLAHVGLWLADKSPSSAAPISPLNTEYVTIEKTGTEHNLSTLGPQQLSK